MPDLIPISEQIVMAIAAILRGITTDAGAYANNAVVERYRPDGNAKGVENATMQIVLQEEVPTDDPSIAPGTLAGYRMQVGIFFYPLQAGDYDEQDEQAMGRFIATAHADIRKALDADEANRQLGGLALNSTLMPPESDWSLGEQPACRLPLNVTFWTDQDDPYRQSWRT